MNLSKLWEIAKDREAWHAEVHGVAKSRTQLRNWTTVKTHPSGPGSRDPSLYSLKILNITYLWMSGVTGFVELGPPPPPP